MLSVYHFRAISLMAAPGTLVPIPTHDDLPLEGLLVGHDGVPVRLRPRPVLQHQLVHGEVEVTAIL